MLLFLITAMVAGDAKKTMMLRDEADKLALRLDNGEPGWNRCRITFNLLMGSALSLATLPVVITYRPHSFIV
ncbi:hypothetical protein ABCW43_22690 [Neorhizobium sp. IRAMC:178]|uniref:hypothetical protein n=1 Tax=Neorhizobium tunisiense TaxID=3144793 RepID=UPI0031F638CA